MKRSVEKSMLSRRALLGTAASGLAIAPLLPLLAKAQSSSGPPLRLVLMYQPHGIIRGAAPFEAYSWLPQGDQGSLTLSDTLSPLEAHKSKLTIIDGLDMTGGSYGAPEEGPHTRNTSHLWSGSPLDENSKLFSRDQGGMPRYFGWGLGTSIDQTIAAKVGLTTPFQSIEAGVRTGGGSRPMNRMIYKAPGQPLSPENNPKALFDRIFAGFMPTDPASMDKLAAERKSVLDNVAKDLTRLQGTVAVEDRAKVQAHLDALRAIEGRLNGFGLSCAPVAPAGVTDPTANDNMPAVTKMQMDVLAQALACGSTNVASLQMDVNENSSTRFTWVLPGETRGHHEISHLDEGDGPEGVMALAKIQKWYASQLAYFLDRLAAIPEGNGTLLDNTLVLWGTEVAVGSTHSEQGLPFILAGGTSRLKAGRFLKFTDNTRHARLLVSVANQFGLDLTTYGTTDTGSGPLPGLT
ncbi:MAG: DUF1552 domain-containing protein [Polyangiaceae bacterium]|nr:DUF1552 domain-containing protein [Polyangiaceae bacterium]